MLTFGLKLTPFSLIYFIFSFNLKNYDRMKGRVCMENLYIRLEIRKFTIYIELHIPITSLYFLRHCEFLFVFSDNVVWEWKVCFFPVFVCIQRHALWGTERSYFLILTNTHSKRVMTSDWLFFFSFFFKTFSFLFFFFKQRFQKLISMHLSFFIFSLIFFVT